MITIIQRVTQASVSVNDKITGKIAQGIMALVAVEKNDTEKQADRLLQRILNYRIFNDQNNKMNLSLRDIDGGLLLVPQFTLAANTQKGNRPSFTSAGSPQQSKMLFDYLLAMAKQHHPKTESGLFGADMQVALINDGPVTFTLQVRNE